jgi:hypothetical protein
MRMNSPLFVLPILIVVIAQSWSGPSGSRLTPTLQRLRAVSREWSRRVSRW